MKQKEYGIAVHWNYIGVSVIFLSIITVLVMYMPNIREIDYSFLRGIRAMLSPFPSYIPLLVGEFGRANHMLWPQIAAGCTLVSHRLYLKAFMLILLTQCTYMLKDFMKDIVCRIRPDGCGVEGFGFPSGHASTSMCFYGIIIYLIYTHVRNDLWRNILMITFGVWIFLAGISRVWLGVHFPLDVIAGWLLGYIMVNIYIILDKSICR